MSTTEDYLDQLLKNASEKKETSDGELDFIEKDETMEASRNENLVEDNSSTAEFSLEQAMEMSVHEVLSEMENIESFESESARQDEDAMFESEELEEEPVTNEELLTEEVGEEFTGFEEVPNEPEEESEEKVGMEDGMLDEAAIAAMFGSEESEEEPEAIEEAVAEEPVTIEEAVAEEPVTIEEAPIEEVTAQEAAAEEDSMEMGMLDEAAIAAMFESGNTEESAEEILEPEVGIEDSDVMGQEVAGEISLDDMLAEVREETTDAEDIGIENDLMFTEGGEEMAEPEEKVGEGENILDLLNLMTEDEDLKDIGDLLKADEDSNMMFSADELFGESTAEESLQSEEPEEEKKEKTGFFAKLFGKKKKEEEQAASEGDENEQIIKQVEEEMQEEAVEEAPKKEKKKKDKKKGKKKDKKKQGEEDGLEGEDGEEGKKGKKEKKKKEKKPKEPKVREVTPKEPPLPKKPVILILLMAASVLALVLLSNKVINYQMSISKADNLFINRNYEEAYQSILGVKVKEDDEQLYDRIRIMMKLESKYKMYLAHIENEEYDEALNDLIMGVIKYDQYAKDAEELGITKAYDDQFALIEEQLNLVFGVDANQAREWYLTLSALDYTNMVRSVVKAAGYSIEEPEVIEEETENEDYSEYGIQAVE